MPHAAFYLLIAFALLLGLFMFVRLTDQVTIERVRVPVNDNDAGFNDVKIDPDTTTPPPQQRKKSLQFLPTRTEILVSSPSAATIEQFVAQAPGRKKMMEGALHKGDGAGILDVFLPLVPEVYCPDLVRIGPLGDGGKWICAPWMANRGCVVYSLGSRNDISFEEAFQASVGRRCVIRTVDQDPATPSTLRRLKAVNGKYRQAYITTATNKAKGHYRIRDLMEEEGHSEMEFLKIDIEGAEHDVLPLFLSSVKMCQIMVEIHDITRTALLLHTFGKFGYMLMHFEVNPYAFGRGISEYSFIHKNCTERYNARLLAQYLA